MTVKYFSSVERTIFLHFLNREACEACNTPQNWRAASQIVEAMIIAHCSKMAVNVSQLLEYCGNNARFLSSIFNFSDAGLITLISSAPTINEFISSRRQIYQHDRERYPMYFDDNASFATRFKIGQINTTSTTTVLTRRIFDWGDQFFDPVNRVMNDSDREVARRSRDLIQQITMKGMGQAVTRAMYRGEYNGKKLPPEALAVAGRMISGIYIDQYRSEYEFAQCCGVPGLQYYDQEKWFPYYDFELVVHLCNILGYADLKRHNQSVIRYQRLSLYNSEEHRIFVGLFNVLLECTMFHVISEGNRSKLSNVNLAGVRSQMINVLSALAEHIDPPASVQDLKGFFVSSAEVLMKMSRVGSGSSQAFAAKWAENMEPVEEAKKILLLTATDTEDQMLLRELRTAGFSIAEPRQLGNTIARVFGPRWGVRLYHVRSNAGSSGSGGSALTAADAIDALQPDFVISVGIAFGIDKSSQSMHDLLISTRIWNYEPGRLTVDEITARGEELPASSLLLDASRHVREEGENVHFGIIASGEKLVDSSDFIKTLKNQKAQLIGGEMEGSGISAVCQRKKHDWIMFKSICDWGENKTKEFQAESAKRAAIYCIRVIRYISTVQA